MNARSWRRNCASAMGLAATWIGFLCALPQATEAQQQPPGVQTVRIGVLSLFRATELRLSPTAGTTLTLKSSAGIAQLKEPARISITLAPSGLLRVAGLNIGSDTGSDIGSNLGPNIVPDLGPDIGPDLEVSAGPDAHDPNATNFWLEVPSKLRRAYAGSLQIRVASHGGKRELEAIVTMPLETAVASVVEAESPPGAGREALKAQAVAARSFLVAKQSGHVSFDFCDTTHCQFLRSPPLAGSPASAAAAATRGLILTWHDDASAEDKTLPAMYAHSCGGRTRTLREIGIRPSGYPYYAVHCSWCSRHPEAAKNKIAEPQQHSERDRLAYNRIHGWGAIPSLTGLGMGHGLGLCQLGAADLARRGATFTQILAHFYPNTHLAALPQR